MERCGQSFKFRTQSDQAIQYNGFTEAKQSSWNPFTQKKWGTYTCIRINYKIPFLPFSLPKQSAFLYSSINESPANGNKTEWKSTHVYAQRFIFKAKQRNKSHSFQLFEYKSSIKCIFTVVIIILVGRYGWLSGNEKHTSAQH